MAGKMTEADIDARRRDIARNWPKETLRDFPWNVPGTREHDARAREALIDSPWRAALREALKGGG